MSYGVVYEEGRQPYETKIFSFYFNINRIYTVKNTLSMIILKKCSNDFIKDHAFFPQEILSSDIKTPAEFP